MGSNLKCNVIKEENLMKKLVVFAIVLAFLAVPLTAFGTMGHCICNCIGISGRSPDRLRDHGPDVAQEQGH